MDRTDLLFLYDCVHKLNNMLTILLDSFSEKGIHTCVVQNFNLLIFDVYSNKTVPITCKQIFFINHDFRKAIK